jgi:hypothetical protein
MVVRGEEGGTTPRANGAGRRLWGTFWTELDSQDRVSTWIGRTNFYCIVFFEGELSRLDG